MAARTWPRDTNHQLQISDKIVCISRGGNGPFESYEFVDEADPAWKGQKTTLLYLNVGHPSVEQGNWPAHATGEVFQSLRVAFFSEALRLGVRLI